MLSEFAVEPDLLSTWHDFRFFISQFGWSNGRLISRYPKKWKRMVIEAAQDASAIDFQRIEESLLTLDPLLIPRTSEWDPREDWLPNAMNEHSKRPFYGILARSNPLQATDVVCANQIEPNLAPLPKLWEPRTSIPVVRRAETMAKCVSLLLRHCSMIHFVDPHFDPGNRRHTLPLQAFLKIIESRRAQNEDLFSIHYHTGDKNKDLGSFKVNLERWVRPFLPSGSQLEIVRWKEEQLHNRYILTDLGGVMFGNGLDQDDNEPPSIDSVTILNPSHCCELLEDYSPTSRRFTWLNDTICIKSAATHDV